MAQHHHGGHDHGHAHSHAPADFGRAFAIGITLNIGFVIVEGAVGLLTGSMALLADAGHNLSDVLGLAIAWAGATLAKRPPTSRFTYGLRGSTILAALANALLLLVALGAILVEAVGRLGRPVDVPGGTIIAVAAAGVVINLATALLFARGRKGDINIRGAYLHMAADAAVSAGVVLAGIAILATGATWLDAAISIVIALIILWNTWGLLRQSLMMFLAAVPEGIDPAEVHHALTELPGVEAVHDLHIWPMSTTETVMTAHLVMPAGHPGDGFLAEVSSAMRRRFGIGHITIQVELERECAVGAADCQTI